MIILFLQTWRAAIIPIVAIPVSLIGSFFAMAAFGFSLNNLTLFGLVLAIGIVVDDAIVVVENVERYLQEGLSPRDAAHKTMDEVGGALIAIALVLCAVFIPTAFIPGISGTFYRQFALTITTSTVISAVVSLTLSPALAALFLRPHGGRVGGFLRVSMLMLIYGGLIGITYFEFTRTPSGFIPPLIGGILLPRSPQAALRTDRLVRRASRSCYPGPGGTRCSLCRL